MNQNEIYHHGIKGQKWGVRRYQNADGSLTEKGKHKLASYRSKALDKENKKYEKKERILKSKTYSADEKYKQKVLKYGSDSDKAVKSKKELTRAMTEEYYQKGLHEYKKSKIKNMTYDDLKKEKHIEHVAAGQTVVATMLAGAFGAILITNTTNSVNAKKDSYRTRDYDHVKALTEAYKKANSEIDGR